jgi:hypothetical protein
MPRKMWQNACCETAWHGAPSPCSCAASRKDQRSRWSLGMHEAMMRYQLRYGLKPIGPHRKLADALLNAVTERCSRCDGGGLFDARDGATWRLCPHCRGFGVLPLPNAPELKAVRAEVGARFPGAVVPNADNVGSDSLRHVLQNRSYFVHDLQTGAMIFGTFDEKRSDE